MDDLINTSTEFLQMSRNRYPAVPIFVSGLSMGGLVSLYMGLKHSKIINGCVLLNPAFRDNRLNNGIAKKFMIMAGIVLPKMKTLQSAKNNGSFYNLDKYKKEDPYIYSGRIWTSTTSSLLLKMNETTSLFP